MVWRIIKLSHLTLVINCTCSCEHYIDGKFCDSISDPSTVFYISYPDQGIARFESAHYRGTYLIIDTDPVTQLRTLRCGVPSGNNDQFEVLQIFGLTPAVLHQGEDCFIAFDSNGEPFGPCGLATTNYEVQISVL